MKMSGSRIDLSKFRMGWAINAGAKKAHYFVRKNGGIISDCGIRFKPELRDSNGFVLFEPGTFDKCKKCEG